MSDQEDKVPQPPKVPDKMTDETWSYIRQMWVETRNDLDKSLLLAASAGIGFCASMLFAQDGPETTSLTIFLLLALIAFSVSAASILLVFKFNANYLHRLLNKPNASNKDHTLGILDWLAISSFVLAVLSIFAAITTHLFCSA